ncbi:MAG: hypothetical protein HY924_00265 [Elusimicrobia bacterium]|nr:hypothetical protein [Elusimicrobiota bacterium]
MNNQNVATWIGSIATLAAVIIALFLQEIRSFWDKPKLDATIRLQPPDCHKTTLRRLDGSDETFPAYYMRIWVSNSGSQMAEKAQVFFAGLTRQQDDGSYRAVETFLPMNLLWAHARCVYMDIAPDMGKHCDLGHIDIPSAHAGPADRLYGKPQAHLFLDLEVLANQGGFIIPPGKYRLEIKVAANNATPVTRTFEMDLTGSWHDTESDMFSKGIHLRAIA